MAPPCPEDAILSSVSWSEKCQAGHLTGHKTRAIFDRYNIINEQELLEAGDQLVAYLAQHAQATPRGGRPHPARTAAPRTAPPLRLVRRTTA